MASNTIMPDKASAVVTITGLDPEMLAHAIRNAQLRPCQLSARAEPSRITRVVCPRVCLDLVALGPALLFEGAMPQDHYTFSYVLKCPVEGRSFNFSTSHTDGYMGLFPPGGMLDAYAPAGMCDALLSVPCGVLHAEVARRFPEIPEHVLRRGAGMRVGETEQVRLRQLIEGVVEAVFDPSMPLTHVAARRQLEVELLDTYLNALSSGCERLIPAPKSRVARRYDHLRKAREYVAEDPHRSLHVGDLALELGLSERGVELLFRDFLGVSPSVYLRNERLHGVRRALASADRESDLVKETAIAWGFWHLGRFAKEYRQLFGESPSETLARSYHS